MKKLMALLLVFTLFVFPACAQELPDTGICLCADGVLVARGTDLGNGFVGDIWMYEHNAETAEGVEIWLYLADLEEFILSETTVDGCAAYQATAKNGCRAILVPDYDGVALLLAEEGIHDLPDDEPQPFQIWQEEVDCPHCHGGRCSLCHGSGVYRAYGQSVSCDPYCAACDGRGVVARNRWN